MCFQKQNRSFNIDPASKLQYIRAQSKLLGYGDQIYPSKRRQFKYIIAVEMDDGSQRYINFGDKGVKDYLDTNRLELKNIWHLMNQQLSIF